MNRFPDTAPAALSTSDSSASADAVFRHPLLAMTVSGVISLVAMAAVVVVALLLDPAMAKNKLQPAPIPFSWVFPVLTLVGTVLVVAAQLAGLRLWIGPSLWPRSAKQWRQRLGPCGTMLFLIVAGVVFQPGNRQMIVLLIPIMLAMAAAIFPASLCLGLWIQVLEERDGELMDPAAIGTNDLPRAVRRHFEYHTAELMALGFRPIGDYRLKQYTPHFARFFLHENGMAIGEISFARAVLLLPPIRNVAFVSLTELGFYLESANMRLNKDRPVVENFDMQGLPGLPAVELWRKHCERLEELNAGPARRLQESELQAVLFLGHKRLYELLVAEGRFHANPYESFDESVLFAGEADYLATREEPAPTSSGIAVLEPTLPSGR